MANRPLTQREIKQNKKDREKTQARRVTITNLGKQTVPIQLRSPEGVDWFVGEQSILLSKGKSALFPVHRLYPRQIENLKRLRYIKVSGDIS